MTVDPLPQRFVTDEPGIGGRIKVRPEDFLVDEIPSYAPCGTGEHLYLGIEKTNVSHNELMSVVSRFFDVPRRSIGFAGMKDKVGVTRQAVSIHLPGNTRDESRLMESSLHRRIRVLWAQRHRNKLKRGHLKGNRFSIRIRDVDPLKVMSANTMLRRLSAIGAPNYFGPQRYGYRLNNHVMGWLLLNEDWAGLLSELLGSGGSAFPEHQMDRRQAFDEGRFDQALGDWATADHAERAALRSLVAGESAQSAVRRIGRSVRSFWISAMQSALFNHVLDRRIEAGTVGSLHEGDLAWRHDNGSVFRVTDETDLDERAEKFEISPSGPLWGPGMMEAGGAVGAMERGAFDHFGWSVDALSSGGPMRQEGARRPLRVPISDVQVDSGIDEHGGYIRAAFDLPRGAYATVVLRELMKVDADALSGRQKASAHNSM